MKKVAVKFEERLNLIRTIVIEIEEDDVEVDFADYVMYNTDEIDEIAERMRDDGYRIVNISDIWRDFENSVQDDIAYYEDRILEETKE